MDTRTASAVGAAGRDNAFIVEAIARCRTTSFSETRT